MRRSTVVLLALLTVVNCRDSARVAQSSHSYRLFQAFGTNDPCPDEQDPARVTLHTGTAEQLIWHFSNSCTFAVKVVVQPRNSHIRCGGDFNIGDAFTLQNRESKVIRCGANAQGRQTYQVKICTIPLGSTDCPLPSGPRPDAHELEIEVP